MRPRQLPGQQARQVRKAWPGQPVRRERLALWVRQVPRVRPRQLPGQQVRQVRKAWRGQPVPRGQLVRRARLVRGAKQYFCR